MPLLTVCSNRRARVHQNTRLSHDTVSVNRLLGMNSPPRSVCDALIDTYSESVHWFMVLFREPLMPSPI